VTTRRRRRGDGHQPRGELDPARLLVGDEADVVAVAQARTVTLAEPQTGRPRSFPIATPPAAVNPPATVATVRTATATATPRNSRFRSIVCTCSLRIFSGAVVSRAPRARHRPASRRGRSFPRRVAASFSRGRPCRRRGSALSSRLRPRPSRRRDATALGEQRDGRVRFEAKFTNKPSPPR